MLRIVVVLAELRRDHAWHAEIDFLNAIDTWVDARKSSGDEYRRAQFIESENGVRGKRKWAELCRCHHDFRHALRTHANKIVVRDVTYPPASVEIVIVWKAKAGGPAYRAFCEGRGVPALTAAPTSPDVTAPLVFDGVVDSTGKIGPPGNVRVNTIN